MEKKPKNVCKKTYKTLWRISGICFGAFAVSLIAAASSGEWNMAVLLASLLRLIALPAALLGILYLIPCPPMVRTILFLCCAMPSGAMCAVQAELYNGDSPLASRGVALSTALSMFSIPVMLLLI